MIKWDDVISILHKNMWCLAYIRFHLSNNLAYPLEELGNEGGSRLANPQVENVESLKNLDFVVIHEAR